MKFLKIGIIVFLLILISSPGSGSTNIREGLEGVNLIKQLTQNAAATITKVSKVSIPVAPIPVAPIPVAPIKSAYEIEKDIMQKHKFTLIGSTNFLINGGKNTINPCTMLYILLDNPEASRELRKVYLENKYISKIFGIQDDDFIDILNTPKNHPILDYMIHKDLLKLNRQILTSNAALPPEITKAMIEKLVSNGKAIINKNRYKIV